MKNVMSILGRYQVNPVSDNITITEVKIALIGDCSVGKTSLISRLILDMFTTDTTSTIGAAYNTLVRSDRNNQYKFQIWDTAGQERFRSLVPMYIKNSKLVFLVFDITSIDSFESVKMYWYDFVTNVEPSAKIILVGNKADMGWKRIVAPSLVDDFVKNHNIDYIETSAKTKLGLDNIEMALIEVGTNVKNQPPVEDIIIVEPPEENILEKIGCTNLRCIT